MGAPDLPTQRIFVLSDWASPKWRLNSGIYRIVDDEAREIPFRMKREQEEFFDALWYWNLILKSRQHGFTTECALIALDQALFTTNFSAGMIAQTKQDAAELFQKKIRTTYDKLPQALRNHVPETRDAAGVLSLANGSSLYVDNSMRGGTLNFLHVSEFGKICATRPDIAQEIKSGAINTLKAGMRLIIESTAEGAEGLFYEWCTDAMNAKKEGRKLTKKSFKLHFFGWHQKPENVLDPEGVNIEPWRKYFAELEANHGIVLTAEQKAWYAETAHIQGDKMKQEHPSTPEEAFAASMEGVIYKEEMDYLRSQGRITDVPWDPKVPVSVGFDLGTRGKTSLWVHQRNGLFHDLIDHHSATNKGVDYFCNWLGQTPYNVKTIYLPHDGNTNLQGRTLFTRADLFREGMPGAEIIIVPRIPSIDEGIAATRPFLRMCRMDRTKCAEGIHSLDHYRWAWDERLGAYSRTPLENGPDHDADSLRQLAQHFRKLEQDDEGAGNFRRTRRNWRS